MTAKLVATAPTTYAEREPKLYEIVFATPTIQPALFPHFTYMLTGFTRDALEFTAVLAGNVASVQEDVISFWPDARILTLRQTYDEDKAFESRSMLVAPMGTLSAMPAPKEPKKTWTQTLFGWLNKKDV